MAPKKKCKSKSNPAPKLNSVKNKIIKLNHVVPKRVGPAKRSLFISIIDYLRRPSRLNPFPFVFGTHSPDLQAMIGRQILNNFDPIQQLKFRAISPMWDYNVRLGCREVRAMVLNFANEKELPGTSNSKSIVLNIKEEELTLFIIELLGKLYCNIEELQIFYASIQDIEKLYQILQHFPKVTEFTIAILEQMTINFMPQLFSIINDHLASLTSLNMGFMYETCHQTIANLKIEHIEKILPYLEGLDMTFKIENLTKLFELIGTNLPAHRPFKRLSVPATFEVSQIEPMFEHNPRLSQTSTFELCIQSVDVLECFVSHMPKLECLVLIRIDELVEGRFTLECIRAIAKLPHLKHLTIKKLQPMTINHLPVSLPSIRELFVVNIFFFENIEDEWHLRNGEHVQPIKVMYKPFVENFAKQFPNLEELLIKTDLSEISSEFKDEFVELCLKEFSKLKRVELVQLIYATD